MTLIYCYYKKLLIFARLCNIFQRNIILFQNGFYNYSSTIKSMSKVYSFFPVLTDILIMINIDYFKDGRKCQI